MGNNDGRLDPGERITCTASYRVTQGESERRLGDQHSAGERQRHRLDQDEPTRSLAQAPHLTLVKDAVLDMTQAGPADRADPGDVISYTLTAVNDGNVTLRDVEIADPSLPSLTCEPEQPVDLAPGAKLTCTGTHPDPGEIEDGNVANSGTVAGTDPTGRHRG